MRVFIGGGGNLVSRQRSAWKYLLYEIEDANAIFTDSRVGMKLEVNDTQTVTPPPTDETTLWDCADGDLLTAAYDHAPAMLHIYLVNDVLRADGITCAASNTRPQAVIYVDMGRSGTLLLHELGHAFGLSLPRYGHWEDVTGKDPANVMASGYASSDKVWRRRLTVGQVVRMNADLGSWLNWAKDPLGGTPLRDPTAPRLACQCGHDDPPGPCPRLVEDVALPRGGSGQALPWMCGDRIKLPPLASGEDPLALIAGRRWRTPLDDCRDRIPGRHKFDVDADYIQTDNLTRPGSCPSWVAVFFRQHAPIFRDLATSPMPRWVDRCRGTSTLGS